MRENGCRKTIDKITGGLEGVIPKLKRHIGMIKKRKASFNEVTVFMLNGTVLFVSVWKRDSMSNATFFKKIGYGGKLTSPV